MPRLTAKGEAVVAAAERLHEDLAVFQGVVGRIKSGAETKLSLAVDAMFPTSALMAFIHELAQAHPGVELALEIEFLAAVTALVRERRATLGIAGTDLDLSGLEQRPLALLRMIPVAAPSHPLAAGKDVITEERRHLRGAADHHPVLGPVPVLLQGVPALRIDDDALDLEIVAMVGDLVPAPGTMDAAMGVGLLTSGPAQALDDLLDLAAPVTIGYEDRILVDDDDQILDAMHRGQRSIARDKAAMGIREDDFALADIAGLVLILGGIVLITLERTPA